MNASLTMVDVPMAVKIQMEVSIAHVRKDTISYQMEKFVPVS